MKVFEHFPYTGGAHSWTVPAGVTTAHFEVWGAAGGAASNVEHAGKVNQVMGGSGRANNRFTNAPGGESDLGLTYANGAGYTAGDLPVQPGQEYFVRVGGNGGPGFSSLKFNGGSSYTSAFRGGNGGFNGGGDGGRGARVDQNLYNAASPAVTYTSTAMPSAAKVNQLWHDLTSQSVKKCNTTYAAGHGSAADWTEVTVPVALAVGSSGGGGGGATDIRFGGQDITDRILIAGGGGGAGGRVRTTGTGAGTWHQVPKTPAPPFGDDTKENGASGPDSTWATGTTYYPTGWGHGGNGGSAGTTSSSTPTVNQGRTSVGESGGSGTSRHQNGGTPTSAPNSGGGGGSGLQGGAAGGNSTAATAAQAGTSGFGGDGATAAGAHDSFGCGGGGGGGGYYGGGGGAQGYVNSQVDSWAGGGGGGSSYASSGFTNLVMVGCARPPAAVGNSGTGANGLGGFARISYDRPPTVKWSSPPSAALAGSTFQVTFDYSPAVAGGAGISHYLMGVGSATDTAPSNFQTIMVAKPSTTSETVTFAAPATAGAVEKVFVQAVDTDGDASAWIGQKVTAVTAAAITAATITSPAANSQFVDTAPVTWTPGAQTPLVAWRLAVSGTDLDTGKAVNAWSAWHRGGSRVNFMTDPGFETSAVWSSTANVNAAPSTIAAGVSGSSGRIVWQDTNGTASAENHTVALDNLRINTKYRLQMGVGSTIANDPRPFLLTAYDSSGELNSLQFTLGQLAANTTTPVTLYFSPTAQGVYFRIRPSASTPAEGSTPILDLDFEDGTTEGFSAGTNDATWSQSGTQALKLNAATATRDLTAALQAAAAPAGNYAVQAAAYCPTSIATIPTVTVSGTGASNTLAGAHVASVAATWMTLRVPFTWDGVNTVTLALNGDPTNIIWWDDVLLFAVDPNSAQFGETDTRQTTFLTNGLLEMVYSDDNNDGGLPYFDGGHLNGNTGAVAWSGAANASPSVLTGADVTSGNAVYTGSRLKGGKILLDTIASGPDLLAMAPVEAALPVNVNPSVPGEATVALSIDTWSGLFTLAINANDATAANKTVSFDILRSDVGRIATGLTPDATTRLASYVDAPPINTEVAYTVRAFDHAGGYADQTTGTVATTSSM